MSLQPSRIADFGLMLTIIAMQVAIARVFLGNWRRRLPGWLARTVFGVLCLLWSVFAIVFALDLIGPEVKLVFLPATLRSALVAIGMVWGTGSTASAALYFLLRACARRLPPIHAPGRRKLLRTAASVVVAAPFAAVGFGGIIERTNFQVVEIDLPIPDLHPDLEGLRVGQLSDLHVSPYLSVRDAGRAVDMMNELRPHLVAITGDLITQFGDPLDETIRELARLRAEAGVVGCLGNHEKYTRSEKYIIAKAAGYGMDFLDHRAREFRWGKGALNVAGVDYQTVQNKPAYLRGAERLIVPGAANLLLSHNPDVFPVAVRQGYDAVLAGHTHGGQVTVEILNQTLNFARFVTPYVAGLYSLEGRSCYVTAGIGTITLPMRLGAKPEITLARLRRA